MMDQNPSHCRIPGKLDGSMSGGDLGASLDSG